MLITFGRCSFNPFHATALYPHPVKTSENLWFSDVFRGYRKRLVPRDGLILSSPEKLSNRNDFNKLL